MKKKTGARGLRSIMENLLLDLMFESPDQKELKKIIINRDVVTKKVQPITLLTNKENNQKLAVNKSWFFCDDYHFISMNSKNIPILPLRDIVVFPHMVAPLFVGRKLSINALNL